MSSTPRGPSPPASTTSASDSELSEKKLQPFPVNAKNFFRLLELFILALIELNMFSTVVTEKYLHFPNHLVYFRGHPHPPVTLATIMEIIDYKLAPTGFYAERSFVVVAMNELHINFGLIYRILPELPDYFVKMRKIYLKRESDRSILLSRFRSAFLNYNLIRSNDNILSHADDVQYFLPAYRAVTNSLYQSIPDPAVTWEIIEYLGSLETLGSLQLPPRVQIRLETNTSYLYSLCIAVLQDVGLLKSTPDYLITCNSIMVLELMQRVNVRLEEGTVAHFDKLFAAILRLAYKNKFILKPSKKRIFYEIWRTNPFRKETDVSYRLLRGFMQHSLTECGFVARPLIFGNFMQFVKIEASHNGFCLTISLGDLMTIILAKFHQDCTIHNKMFMDVLYDLAFIMNLVLEKDEQHNSYIIRRYVKTII